MDPAADAKEPLRAHILHLSDLHFGTVADAGRWAGQLSADLKHELSCDRLDAMIVSGDVANTAVSEEYDAARIFIEKVCGEFGISGANLAVVPGNHDLNWDLSDRRKAGSVPGPMSWCR